MGNPGGPPGPTSVRKRVMLYRKPMRCLLLKVWSTLSLPLSVGVRVLPELLMKLLLIYAFVPGIKPGRLGFTACPNGINFWLMALKRDLGTRLLANGSRMKPEPLGFWRVVAGS